jgi:TolB-like protein/Flp pilus assembly protein TadD
LSFINELRRRNVFRVATAYLAGAWLLVEVAGTLFPIYGLSEAAVRVVVTLLAIGFPITLVLSWVYELTPEGLKLEKDIDRTIPAPRDSTKKLDRIIIVLLALALGYFAFDKFLLSPQRQAEELATATREAHQEGRSEILVESYGEKSIVVLPFVNMSSDPEQEYFSDGISEELLNLLAQVPDLRVISRSSAFSFKGKDIDVPAIAEQLSVAHVLEGSVRKVGNRVRITAQLIEARTDTHLWSQTYDRELDDIFAVQDEIAAQISDVLKVKLALDSVTGETVQLTVVKAANSGAYDAYLRGLELTHTRLSLDEAIRHFERALSLDDNYAPAHAQLAIAFSLKSGLFEITLEEARRRAIPHLDRAQQLEPDLAEAHGGRALLASMANDPESAVEDARRALASNPSYSDAMNWLYVSLRALGRYEEAEVVLKQMLLIDPLHLVGRYNYAEWLADCGRIEEAHQQADQLLVQNPVYGYMTHAAISFNYEGAIAEGLNWALKLSSESGRAGMQVTVLFILAGEYAEARRINEELNRYVDLAQGRLDGPIREAQRDMQLDPDNATVIAEAALFLYLAGRIDEALPLYERAFTFAPEGRPMPVYEPLFQTMRLAFARRNTGDEEGAQAALHIARQDYAARRAAGEKNRDQDQVEAMIAAFEHHPDGVIAALHSAINHGLLKGRLFLEEPIFEDIRNDPRFLALQKELDAITATEHARVLQLICFNNPAPDVWQPLPETCQGVVEQPAS